MSEERNAPERRKVWDLPTRLFHWALVGCFATGWYLGEFRGFDTIELHFYFGYAIGGLVAFRLLWGLVGSPASRLSALFFSPRATLAYVKEMKEPRPSYWPGHAPTGALSVLALLALLAAQVITGLFSEDDGLFAAGPLASSVDAGTRGSFGAYHALGAKLLLFLVIAHVLVIAYYAIWKRENLVHPMISGWKQVRDRQGAGEE